MTDLAQTDTMISSTLEEAWQFCTNNIALLIIAALIHAAVTVLSFGLLSGPITLGFVDLIRRRRLGEVVDIAQIFNGFSHFGTALFASLLMFVMIGIGLLLLIIPGLVLMTGWVFTFQVMAYEKTGAAESMGRSWSLFKTQPLLVAVLGVVALVINSIGSAVLLGTLLTLPFTIVYLCIAFEKMTKQLPA